MAVTGWTGAVSGDVLTAGNWTNGVPSDTTDEVRIAEGSVSLDTNLDIETSWGVGLKTLYIGGTFSGSIGSGGTAFTLDSMDAYPDGRLTVDVDGGGSQIINLDIQSCPTAVILNCGSNTYACYLSGGTYTSLFAMGGQSIRIGAGATVTTLYVSNYKGKPSPQVYIESGATVTNAFLSGGSVTSHAALGTVRVSGTARLYMLGSSTGNITSLSCHGSSVTYLRGAGFTVTSCNMFDQAVIDSNQESYRPWTVTNSAVLNGGQYFAKPTDVFTAAPQIAGGRLFYQGSSVVVVPGDPS